MSGVLEDERRPFSIALMGARGSGKTTLARNACGEVAGPGGLPVDFYLPTMAAACHVGATLGPSGSLARTVEFWEAPLWELAVDPRRHFWERGRDAVVFVVDCGKPEDLIDILRHWVHVARYHAEPSASFLFVGTKLDGAHPDAAQRLQDMFVSNWLPHLLGSSWAPDAEGLGRRVVDKLFGEAPAPRPAHLAALPPLHLPMRPAAAVQTPPQRQRPTRLDGEEEDGEGEEEERPRPRPEPQPLCEPGPPPPMPPPLPPPTGDPPPLQTAGLEPREAAPASPGSCCPAGHPLEPFFAEEATAYLCSRCGAEQLAGAAMLACRACEQVVCAPCAEDGEGLGLTLLPSPPTPHTAPPEDEGPLALYEPGPGPSPPDYAIAREEVRLVPGAAPLDGPGSSAWRQRPGRSPAVRGTYRGVSVVVKSVTRQLLEDRWGAEEEVDLRIRELAELRCEQLVHFLGACFWDGQDPVLLVSEYMEGGNVEQYLRSRRPEPHLPWVPPRARIYGWAVSIARALEHLHCRCDPAIVHGNLRPSNLLLTGGLDLQVATACILSPPEAHTSISDDEPSLEGCLYSAPEVMRARPITEKADIYAFAFIMWFICTGVRPLAHLDNDGSHLPEAHVLQAFAAGRAPRPNVNEVRLGREVRALIQKAWHVDPEQRPSAAALLEQLLAAEVAAGGPQCCCVQ